MINICEEIETINTDNRGVEYWIEDLPREGYLYFAQGMDPDWPPFVPCTHAALDFMRHLYADTLLQ